MLNYIVKVKNLIQLEKTSGLFGESVLKHFPHLAIEDEGRLKNFTIRDYFFIKLFTFAAFRKLKSSPSHSGLVEFHAKNKCLFMAFHPGKVKELGRIVANSSKKPVHEVYKDYEAGLFDLLSRPYSYSSNLNVFYHIMGYFKKFLSEKEKAFFLSMLEQFKQGRMPKISILSLLYSWSIRFEQEYLLNQTFFQPYPEQLMDLTDSGKGRNLA